MRALPALLCCLAAAASARYELAPGHPWTWSVTGAEAPSALELDWEGRLWIAGTTWNPGTNRDVMLLSYSTTQTAVAWSGTIMAEPWSSTTYDRAGLDEGIP